MTLSNSSDCHRLLSHDEGDIRSHDVACRGSECDASALCVAPGMLLPDWIEITWECDRRHFVSPRAQCLRRSATAEVVEDFGENVGNTPPAARSQSKHGG